MLGVAALLASSSMAAIELITLYAWMDNAVHKMGPPSSPLASHLSLQKRLLLKNSLVLSGALLSVRVDAAVVWSHCGGSDADESFDTRLVKARFSNQFTGC